MFMQAWQWSMVLGFLLIARGFFCLSAPGPAAKMARSFARATWTGRLIAAAAWIWAGWALYVMPLEFLLPFRHWIPVLILLAIPLSWYWMADLLSCRALGGLLVLFPCPMLIAVRANPSAWRLALVIFAYISIMLGMTLILYPYYLRRWLDWLAARQTRMQIWGGTSLAVGGLFLLISHTALR
jgi:hypothetical protein